MSFNCDKCSKTTAPRQPINYVVTEKRDKEYFFPVKRSRENRDRETSGQSEGYETVKEIKTCPQCFTKLTGNIPKVVEVFFQQEKKKDTSRMKDNEFNRPRKVDKTNPNWKYKKELDEIKHRESMSPDPRGEIKRKQPIVETVNRTK